MVDKNRDNINNSGYGFYYNNTAGHGLYVQSGFSGNSNTSIISNYTLTLNNWHHCVFTYENGTAKLYIDGALIYSKMNVAPIVQNDEIMLIGKAVWGGNIFGGKLDDIRIYNRTFSESEISYLANH